MSELGRFLPADQDLLVSLFYRIGVWMSNVDDTDLGEESELAEQAQMLKILHKLSVSKNVGVLSAEIANEAIRHKGSWGRWAQQTDNTIEDVQKAKSILQGQGTEQEYISFGRCLVTIATSVARAYREADDAENTEKGFLSWLSEKKAHVALALTDSEGHKDLNISPAEDTALQELWSALRS